MRRFVTIVGLSLASVIINGSSDGAPATGSAFDVPAQRHMRTTGAASFQIDPVAPSTTPVWESRKTLTYVVSNVRGLAQAASGKGQFVEKSAPVKGMTGMTQRFVGVELLTGYAYVDIQSPSGSSSVGGGTGAPPALPRLFFPFIVTHHTHGGAEGTQAVVYVVPGPTPDRTTVYYMYVPAASGASGAGESAIQIDLMYPRLDSRLVPVVPSINKGEYGRLGMKRVSGQWRAESFSRDKISSLSVHDNARKAYDQALADAVAEGVRKP